MHGKLASFGSATLFLLLAACSGPGASPSPSPLPTPTPSPTAAPSANVAIVRIETSGGFLPPQMTLAHYPEIVLYGDGRLIMQGPQVEIYPGPALPNLVVSQLTQHGVEQVLEWAREAGLVGADRMLGQPIPDAGTTNFTIVYPDGTHTTSLAPGSTDGAEDPQIGAVRQFEQILLNLRAWLPDDVVGDDAPYAWDRLWIITNPADPQNLPDPQLANEKDWPLASLATLGQPMSFGPDYRCVVIEGANLATLQPLLVEANQLTLWRSDDQLYQSIIHPMLPDDEGCPSF